MYNESELRALDFRIGRNADRIIAKGQSVLYTAGVRGRPQASFSNCVLPEMMEVRMSGEEWPLWVDDVLAGITRLDWYAQEDDQMPLSMGKMLKIFSSLDIVSPSSISQLLQTGRRQAMRYYKACAMAHQKLIDGYCEMGIHSLTYPETFIYYRRAT
jgi:hypothetical protein